MAYEKDPAEIGALWTRDGAKGEYMTGTIEGIGDVICFPVNSPNPKAPTWRVKKSQPREQRPSRRDEGHTDAPNDVDIPF